MSCPCWVTRIAPLILAFEYRHFLKEDLPRIRFANPNLDIQVQQAKKTEQEKWRPEIELELGASSINNLSKFPSDIHST